MFLERSTIIANKKRCQMQVQPRPDVLFSYSQVWLQTVRIAKSVTHPESVSL